MNSRSVTAGCLLCIVVAITAAAPKAWVLRFDGVGPVKIGMSLKRLNTTLNESFSMPEDQDEKACFYAESDKHPGVAFMVENGRVTRVDVTKGNIATTEGIRVGDSETRVSKIYGHKLQVAPHFYEDGGHYLTVSSDDKKYGIRFETNEGKVTSFYAGEIHAISYVEGCS